MTVLAICVSDVHLSLRPPIAREQEPDWREAQLRPWREIMLLVEEHGCGVVVAGDLFDRWNPPIELVNWSLDHLPWLWAIPGNHDLPAHNLEGLHRSGYGTLMRAGHLTHLTPSGFTPRHPKKRGEKRALVPGPMTLYGFPFGTEIAPPPKARRGRLNVAVVHEYFWTKGTGYADAEKSQRLTKNAERFKGFDIVVIGDNHQAFTRKIGDTIFVNCGTTLRRKSNEVGYRPRAALIHDTGEVTEYQFNTEEDIITVVVDEEPDEDVLKAAEFVEELAQLAPDSFSFRELMLAAVKRADVSPAVRDVIKEAMDG